MTIDWEQPYPHARRPVFGRQMVATSQPLAAQAGLRMLHLGGNAADAAVATAAMLTVVHPTNNGLGADAFALVSVDGQVDALNSSGRSPASLDPDRFAGAPMPWMGWDTVTVPGAVGGWAALSERYGRLGFDTALAPAIDYARHGWPVGVSTAGEWATPDSPWTKFPHFADAFLPDGRPPRPGELFRLEGQADTLQRIADNGPSEFYRGQTAELIAAHAARYQADLSAADLAAFTPEWQAPISLRYRGVDVYQLGPAVQGVATLIALGVLERCADYPAGLDSPESIHLEAEAMKLALCVIEAELADPDFMRVTVDELLSDAHLSLLASRVDVSKVAATAPEHLPPGGTVYLAAADSEGMLVSLIQSCYFGFGSGIVVPGAGISMHNRGAGFVTEPGHPNCVGPNKRPFHTIMPGLAVDPAGAKTMAFGLVGGPMQPQGNLQLLTRVIDHDQNPQTALDGPRWRVEGSRDLALEDGTDPGVSPDLESRGHRIIEGTGLLGGYGAGQIIQRAGDLWVGGTDARKEGQVATS